MSRIGNMILTIPAGATVMKNGSLVVVKGPKGELTREIPQGMGAAIDGDKIKITQKNLGKAADALHGMVRARLANDLTAVTTGWSKSLELSGVGYRANMAGTSVMMTVGFSHPVTIDPPAGITFAITDGKIIVTGIDKDLVGQTAANIRAVKKPEPYKGKGIKYVGEYIRKKAGKSAKTVGSAPGAK